MNATVKFREYRGAKVDGNPFRWIIDEAMRARNASLGRFLAVRAQRRDADRAVMLRLDDDQDDRTVKPEKYPAPHRPNRGKVKW